MHQKHLNALVAVRSPRLKRIQKEIIKALLYSDIFDYPLTGDQIFQYLGIHVTGKEFIKVLKTIPYVIAGNTLYYHLPKRHSLVDQRLQKEKWSMKKIEKVQEISSMLSYLPTIRFIGISGSVALKNAAKNADTDLFFICAPYTVWITRFCVYFFLQLLGLRRKRDKKTSDSLCPNMFMDERFLTFPKTKRNVYIAHEIAQVVPLIDKGNFRKQLFLANKWIQEYFPNMLFPKIKKEQKKPFWNLIAPLEYLLYHVQLLYMQKHKTRETTTQHIIAFHPIDYEKLTLSLYNKKERSYGI